MPDATPEQLAQVKGLVKLRLRQIDAVERDLHRSLAKSRSAKAACEKGIAVDLGSILLGGLPWLDGGRLDLGEQGRIRAARRAALAAVNRRIATFEAALLPPKVRA